MSIQKQLELFQKTDRFRMLVAEKMKNDPSFAGVEEIAVQFGDRMREILSDEVSTIKSSITDEAFLDHIIVEEAFVPGLGWTINVSFDEELMHRDSLYPQGYPDGVQLDVLFNEGYSASAHAYGTSKYGYEIYSKKSREALRFIQRAVDRFNVEQKGKAVAEYNSKYTGGTL